MNAPEDFVFTRYGEHGWLAICQRSLDDVASGLLANAVADVVRPEKGITDAVAGINSIAIRFDSTQLDANDALALLRDATKKTLAPNDMSSQDTSIEIPVLFGGDAGPDFEAVCAQTNLSQMC